jgi:hypothetical protein
MASTIQVDKIQDTGGNTIVESDGSGAATTRIPATYLGSGTASSTTVLYGDQTYKTEPSGGVTGIATSMTSGTGINLAVNGEITMPLQPAFLLKGASAANFTSTATKVDFSSEVFDQNSDVSSSIFTAPVTGRYLFSAQIGKNDATYTDDDVLYFYLTTSNQNFQSNMGGDLAVPFTWTISIVCDMDASDTAQIKIYNVNNRGAVETGAGQVWFSGCLLA